MSERFVRALTGTSGRLPALIRSKTSMFDQLFVFPGP